MKKITCDRCGKEDEGMQEILWSDKAHVLCPEHLRDYDAYWLKSWDLSSKDHERRILKWLNNQ